MGRPAKPAALKLAQGNPGKRPIVTLAPGAGVVPPAPAGLGPGAVAHWVDLWTRGRSWLVPMRDEPVMRLLAELLDERDQLMAARARDGLFIRNSQGLVNHPATAAIRAIEGRIQPLLKAQGLTATDGLRLGLSFQEAESKLAKLLRERGGQRGD